MNVQHRDLYTYPLSPDEKPVCRHFRNRSQHRHYSWWRSPPGHPGRQWVYTRCLGSHNIIFGFGHTLRLRGSQRQNNLNHRKYILGSPMVLTSKLPPTTWLTTLNGISSLLSRPKPSPSHSAQTLVLQVKLFLSSPTPSTKNSSNTNVMLSNGVLLVLARMLSSMLIRQTKKR